DQDEPGELSQMDALVHSPLADVNATSGLWISVLGAPLLGSLWAGRRRPGQGEHEMLCHSFDEEILCVRKETTRPFGHGRSRRRSCPLQRGRGPHERELDPRGQVDVVEYYLVAVTARGLLGPSVPCQRPHGA